LLNWSVAELCDHAKLDRDRVKRFEGEAIWLTPFEQRDLVGAFFQAGVIGIEKRLGGAGVRFRQGGSWQDQVTAQDDVSSLVDRRKDEEYAPSNGPCRGAA